MRKAAILVLFLTAGCARSEAQNPAPAGNQIIIAVDLSGSQSEARRAQAQSVAMEAVKHLSNGDEIVILQVHQHAAAEDGATRWREVIPDVRKQQPTQVDREEVANVQRAATAVLEYLFDQDSAGTIPTTDILSTMHIVADFRRESGPRSTTLLLLSDMVQSANGMEMSHRRGVPTPDWIAGQQEAGLIPNLSNICISVVGADASTAAGLRIRKFWEEYFAAAGATLPPDNYRLLSVGNPISRCGVATR